MLAVSWEFPACVIKDQDPMGPAGGLGSEGKSRYCSDFRERLTKSGDTGSTK